ncbi:hypothetical protein GCM10010331_17240 [Streptomyces xanthochromogenes]|uniref:hypothetical protein n=1 Tax=Streptomyces TaxID=1883 RepID=UPI001423222E|nr:MULTISPECIES: hypothetical protein [Streptomyces]GHB31289.1 hypothetical protein GCM10010331_17240 [Streptomyces xanthochromogenes]
MNQPGTFGYPPPSQGNAEGDAFCEATDPAEPTEPGIEGVPLSATGWARRTEPGDFPPDYWVHKQ